MRIEGAWAFDDAECSRIVTTSQHQPVEIRPGEAIEIARARAMDEVSKLAVAEVVGGYVDSSRDDTSDLTNESDTRHARDPASPTGRETGEDRNGVESKAVAVAKSHYRGLVRVKLRDEVLSGSPGHQTLDVSADVTVCQPKPDSMLAADRLPPQVVDPDKSNWFNPNTGEPQLWYWMGADNTYIFFDKAGFDPNTGDPLKRVDRAFQRDWKALMAKRRKAASDLLDRQQKDAAIREAQAAAVRQAADLRAAQDAKIIQGCDSGAANPNDPRRPASVASASWDVLKAGVAAAIQDCEMAVRLQPAEARFRYQLARAYSVNDPKRALPLFKRLCEERYPAAYDNYGWEMLDRRVGRNDMKAATEAFQTGVEADDSDAMVSLAGFMKRGTFEEAGPEDALLLYRRAAKLGNSAAVDAVAEMEAGKAQAETIRAKQAEEARQDAIRQQQAAQVFMGAMGNVLRNVGHR